MMSTYLVILLASFCGMFGLYAGWLIGMRQGRNETMEEYRIDVIGRRPAEAFQYEQSNQRLHDVAAQAEA